jgi:hypothetical protein
LGRVELAVLKLQLAPVHREDAAALLALGVAAGVEDDPVAGFEGGSDAVEFDPV